MNRMKMFNVMMVGLLIGFSLKGAEREGTSRKLTDLFSHVAQDDIQEAEACLRIFQGRFDINGKDPFSGATLLFQAKSDQMIRMLVEAGADLNAVDSDGNTALHKARTVAIAQSLVTRGARRDARNKQGQTPLHAIAQRPQNEQAQAIARFLLRMGVPN